MTKQKSSDILRKLSADDELMKLIRKREQSERATANQIIFLDEIPVEESEETKILRERLSQMDSSELNMLIGVMYYGSSNSSETSLLQCVDIYTTLQRLVPGWPWDKSRAVEKLMEKSVLTEYLERGFKGLGFVMTKGAD